jgi:hypothetical protein
MSSVHNCDRCGDISREKCLLKRPSTVFVTDWPSPEGQVEPGGRVTVGVDQNGHRFKTPPFHFPEVCLACRTELAGTMARAYTEWWEGRTR